MRHVLVAAAILATPAVAAQQPAFRSDIPSLNAQLQPALEDVLQRMHAYLADYANRLPAMVATRKSVEEAPICPPRAASEWHRNPASF